MKICIITNTFSSDLTGGSNVYTNSIVRELQKRNHEIVVIAASPDREDSIKMHDAIKIHHFHPLNICTCSEIGEKSILKQGLWTILDIYNCYSYTKIIKILEKENPDVVHLHTPLDITLSAFDAVKKMKLPLVFTAHDYILLCRKVVLLHGSGEICTDENINKFCKLYRILTKKIIDNKTDVVIFPSQFISRIFTEKGFFKKSKKAILPYPVQLNNIKSYKTNTDTDNQSLNILYVGSLTRHKGIQILIKAVKLIKKDSIKLTIIGSGIYKNKLENLAGTDKRITFYGKVRNEYIESCYNKSDVLVVPSVWNEVFGIVVLEAFRAGVPVIASRIGGITEIVKNKYNGFLFESGNISQLKQILENILENPKILVELGNNAKNCVKQYEISEHIKRLLLNYEEAIRLNKMRQGPILTDLHQGH